VDWKSLAAVRGVVSHAGLVLLRHLADQTGLTGGLSAALATARILVHDRGRVLANLACAIADGARVRRLPWQRSTASWQAAYNTACLYAALADTARKDCAPELVLRDLEHRVIVSLRRAVDNPHSELERPSDWIDSDPDFHAMCDDPQFFTAFEGFLLDQMRQDYPDSFIVGKCSVPHTTHGKSLAVRGRRLNRAQFPIRSPVPGPVATGNDGTHEDRGRVWPTKATSPETPAAASTGSRSATSAVS
jgi:hypothetical protein